MQGIVSRLEVVLIAVNRSAIHLHTIAVERAIHALKRAQRRMVMFVVKSGVDPNAPPKKRELKVEVQSKQVYSTSCESLKQQRIL